MGIIIEGIEFPTCRTMLEILPDGRVFKIHPLNNARIPLEAKASPYTTLIPPEDDKPSNCNLCRFCDNGYCSYFDRLFEDDEMYCTAFEERRY